MACLDMYNQNPDHKPPMSPRISFSNDFAESNHSNPHSHSHSHHHNNHMIKPKPRSDGPVSSDFEFSALSNNSMLSADELFSKGRLLPFKNGGNSGQLQRTTLREELLVDDDDGDDVAMTRPPKGSSARWKELLGLRKNQNGSKKAVKSDGCGEIEKMPCLVLVEEEAHVSKSPQEMLNDGESSCRDVEFGM